MNRGHVAREDDGVVVADVQEIFTCRGCSVSGGFHTWIIFTSGDVCIRECSHLSILRLRSIYIDPGSCSGDIAGMFDAFAVLI